MNLSEIIDQINAEIVANGTGAITADVLNPILIGMVGQINDLTGALEDSTVAGDTIVEMINALNTALSGITAPTIYTGSAFPSPIAFPDATTGDYYLQADGPTIIEGYIHNGIGWVVLKNWINDATVSDVTTWSSQKIKDYLDAVDRLLSIGTLTVEGGFLTIPAGAYWRIGGVIYSNPADVSIAIPAASTGMYRTDLIVANNTGGFTRVAGTESPTYLSAPAAPASTVAVGQVSVFGSDLSVSSLQSSIAEAVKKSYAKVTEFDGSGTDTVIPLNANGYSEIRLINAGLVSVSGVDLSLMVGDAAEQPYAGKPFTIVNLTGAEVILKHGDFINADTPLLLRGGLDLTIPDKQSITLNWDPSGMYESDRSWLEYEEVLGLTDELNSLTSTSVKSFSRSINGVDNTKFDFTVSGTIRNPTTGAVVKVENQAFSGVTVSHNANGVTYFGLKEDLTLTQQSTRFTTEQKYNHLSEWAVIYSPSTFVIITFNDFPNVANQLAQQLHNFMKNTGVRNLGDNQYTNYGTTILNIYKPIGGIVEGVGWGNLDADNPNEKNMPAITSADTFDVRKSTGTHLAAQTVIDPTIYEPGGGGTVSTVPSSTDVTVYRISFFNSNLTRVQMGQTVYANIDTAIAKTIAKADAYTTEQNIADNGITVTYLAIQKNCTAWSQTTRFKFFPAPQSSNALSATFVTFDSIYNSVTSPQLHITDSKGALDIKSERASNTSPVMRGYDNMGTLTWYINADGSSSFLPDLEMLSDATLPLSDTNELLVNQSGTWKKVDKSEIIGGGDVTLIHKFSGNGTSITNSPNFSLGKTYSVLIPANTIQVGDFIKIEASFEKVSGGAVEFYHEIHVNTIDSLSGSLTVAATAFIPNGRVYSKIQRTLVVKSSTVTEIFHQGTQVASDYNSAGVSGNRNIDWTTDKYIIFVARLNGATDAVSRLTNCLITKI